MNNYIDIILIR